MQARLTARMKNEAPLTIATMPPGPVYYTVPWALRADDDELLWLVASHEVTTAPFGTSEMQIQLLPDGFHVWPPVGRAYGTSGIISGALPVAVVEE